MKNNLTIIVTCFNHEEFVRQCLDSILDQTIKTDYLIVCDDSSSDRTRKIIDQVLDETSVNYLKIYNQKNLGVCQTLNLALSHVKTDFFIHISGDDWMQRDRIEKQLRFMKKTSSNVAFGMSSLIEVDLDGETIKVNDYTQRIKEITNEVNQYNLLPTLLRSNLVTAPSVILRTECVLHVGGYDPNISFEDYDLWLRLSHNYSMVYIPGALSNYRVNDQSMSRNPIYEYQNLKSEYKILEKHKNTNSECDSIIFERQRHIREELSKKFGILLFLQFLLDINLNNVRKSVPIQSLTQSN